MIISKMNESNEKLSQEEIKLLRKKPQNYNGFVPLYNIDPYIIMTLNEYPEINMIDFRKKIQNNVQKYYITDNAKIQNAKDKFLRIIRKMSNDSDKNDDDNDLLKSAQYYLIFKDLNSRPNPLIKQIQSGVIKEIYEWELSETNSHSTDNVFCLTDAFAKSFVKAVDEDWVNPGSPRLMELIKIATKYCILGFDVFFVHISKVVTKSAIKSYRYDIVEFEDNENNNMHMVNEKTEYFRIYIRERC